MKSALDRLSDAELEQYTEPKEIASASEAHAYMVNIETQSPQYTWRRNRQCIFLLAGSRQAKLLGVPGVVFEFMIRTGESRWTVYQIPDPDNLFEHPVHLYRNELVAYSQRPVKSPMPLKQEHVHGKLYELGRTLGRAAAALFA